MSKGVKLKTWRLPNKHGKALKKKKTQQHDSWKSLPWLPKYMDEKINWIPDLPMTPQLDSTGNKRESGFFFPQLQICFISNWFHTSSKAFLLREGPAEVKQRTPLNFICESPALKNLMRYCTKPFHLGRAHTKQSSNGKGYYYLFTTK